MKPFVRLHRESFRTSLVFRPELLNLFAHTQFQTRSWGRGSRAFDDITAACDPRSGQYARCAWRV